MDCSNFSAIILVPTRAFFIWLGNFSEARQLGAVEDLYSTREEPVWVIPNVRSFTKTGELDLYLSDLKPLLLRVSLNEFGATEQDLNEAISEKLFDEYFVIDIRESIVEIEELRRNWDTPMNAEKR